MRRRKSTPMSQCLQRPAPRLARLLRRAAAHAQVDADFQASLPFVLRGHCQLAGYRDGGVLLHVDSSAWATRLRYALPEMTEHSELLRAAETIRVKVRPAVSSPPQRELPRPHLSCSAAQVLLDCSQHLQHPSLAASLQRLARHGKHQKPN